MVVEACWFERVTGALEGRENRRVSHLLICSSQEVDRAVHGVHPILTALQWSRFRFPKHSAFEEEACLIGPGRTCGWLRCWPMTCDPKGVLILEEVFFVTF